MPEVDVDVLLGGSHQSQFNVMPLIRFSAKRTMRASWFWVEHSFGMKMKQSKERPQTCEQRFKSA